jgi:hypothetical protein
MHGTAFDGSGRRSPRQRRARVASAGQVPSARPGRIHRHQRGQPSRVMTSQETTMRLLAAFIAACLVVPGCAPPNGATAGATSNDTLTFPVGPTFAPTPPIDDTTETITFTVQNNSPDGSSLNNIPYVINRDGVEYSSASIATIGPNAQATIIFTVTETDGLPHTYEVVLDPNDTTGAINTSNNTQSITIDWQPSGTG